MRLVGCVALKCLLDRGLANTRGRRTQATVEDSIIGKQGERPSCIPSGEGLDSLLQQCRRITLGVCDGCGSKRQESSKQCHEAERPVHGVSSWVASSLGLHPREMCANVVGNVDDSDACIARFPIVKSGCADKRAHLSLSLG